MEGRGRGTGIGGKKTRGREKTNKAEAVLDPQLVKCDD